MEELTHTLRNTVDDKSNGTSYEYQPLSDPEGIRLLSIQPGKGSSEITCRLLTVSLAESPDYEALSYTWGNNYKSKHIRYEENLLPVTSNLHSALQRLRHVDKPRLLWADAICINQDDIPERNQQVQLMQRIYQQAREVLIWLGEEHESDAETFRFMNQFGELNIRFHAELHTPQSNQELLHLVSFSSLPRKGIADLLQRPWFSRMWVIQEIAMASKATIFCGSFSTTWGAASKMIQLMRDRGDFVYLGPPSALSISRIGFMTMMKEQIKTEGKMELSLPDVLRSTPSFSSTDPRDRIFAMLGLIRGPDTLDMLPDYSRSNEDVFKDIAIRSFSLEGGGFEMLSLAGGVSNAALNVPSWAPGWIPDPRSIIGLDGQYNTALDSAPAFSFSNDLNWVNAVLGTMGEDRNALILGYQFEIDFFKECEAIASISNPYPTGEDFAEAYTRLLIGDLKIFEGLASSPQQSLKDGYEYWRYTQDHLEDILAQRLNKQDKKMLSSQSEAGKLYHKAIDVAIFGKKFCRTEKRYLGWVGAEAQPGDIVCIFLGASVPYVLRSENNGFYKLVGECYVHGIMYGETLIAGLPSSQEFHIT
ncbi:Heterokaryon incompatibility protein 6 OR allele [Lachnellula suecica]|uniref:Heterokaryon incompatibility protein 6 OR allele n=1 Tax=Lachnellula suecica TaxID=602035 RepID=A0A8T9C5W9_9HELO|nr:Heterokaryon incompatibility protein 6 OR allele [Lachnellula suecica]